MNELYPLKFKPVIIDKIWGGSKLKNLLKKPTESVKAGESWEISGVPGRISKVSHGFLAGNNLEELIEIYMGDLVGDRVFEKFGVRFPLLTKFIDANDMLSIQVHPDDDLAKERHKSFGKTEMWYVLQADPQSELIVGFNREVNKDTYIKHLNEKRLSAILNSEIVKEGDVFFLPSGRIHAIGAGILLAEIQQTSDITYRIYDFDRRDQNGNFRELHTDLAVDAIDYMVQKDYRTKYLKTIDQPVQLAECKYFTTNLLDLKSPFDRDTSKLDSFIIYMCLSGSCKIKYGRTKEVELVMGESLLVPAMMDEHTMVPSGSTKLLEVFIEEDPKTEA